MSAYVIGLDGGGTKTAGVLIDTAGRALARARMGGSAIVGTPSDDARRVLAGIVQTLSAEAGVALCDVGCLVLGLSGVDFADEIPGQHAALSAAMGVAPERMLLVNDGIVALAGVGWEDRLALIQHGTGLTSAYRSAPGQEAIFDSLDIGMVFDIRREAFALTARMIDGRAAIGPLLPAMLAHCGVSAERFADWAWRRPAEARRARLACAAAVFAAWADGCPNAAALIGRAAEDYAVLAQAMAARLGEGAFRLGLGGGVITAGGEAFRRRIAEALAMACPQAAPGPVRIAPEDGAAVMAAGRLGWPAQTVFDALGSAR